VLAHRCNYNILFAVYVTRTVFSFLVLTSNSEVNHMDNELVEKQNKALNVLVEAARLAQARGAFTLEQASLVAEAIAVFKQPEAQSGTQITDSVTSSPPSVF